MKGAVRLASSWLVSLGAKGSRSSATTHTVRLSLTPVRVDAAGNEQRDVLVASELGAREDGSGR